MATKLPILIFPIPKPVEPADRTGGPSDTPEPKNTQARKSRFVEKVNLIKADFASTPGNFDRVLVIETSDKVLNFPEAVRAIPGLEWLGEFDTDFDDEDLAESYPDASEKDLGKVKKAGKRLYMTASSISAFDDLLSLWEKFQGGEPCGKWKPLFALLHDLRLWNHDDMFRENGLLDDLKESIRLGVAADGKTTSATFEVELHFRQNADKRRDAAESFRQEVENAGGEIIGSPCLLENVAFHAFKIRLPFAKLAPFLEAKESNDKSLLSGIRYLQPYLAKYCRPMCAVQIPNTDDEHVESEEREFPPCDDNAPCVVGVMDGAPFLRHSYLIGRIEPHDPNEFADQYASPSDQKHGTAMASLICHGDINHDKTQPPPSSLTRKIYAQPVMLKSGDMQDECVPVDKFPEDVIMEAVRSMLAEPKGKSVKIINLSIGIPHTPFYHSISSLARVLDYLANAYGILFIVSAGNEATLKFSQSDADSVSAKEVISQIDEKQRGRKIISPAESINALTVGALNKDNHSQEESAYIDPLGELTVAATYSRLGRGFRKQIKPDLIVAGGRLHYRRSPNGSELHPINYEFQGLKHAAPSSSGTGELTNTNSAPGTSYATAVTTHAAGEIYEVLESIPKEQARSFDEKYYPLLVKALLVHGASREGISDIYKNTLKSRASQGRWSSYFSRFVGYGVPDFERVKDCTESRVISLGYGDIHNMQGHQYTLPLVEDCHSSEHIRLIVTLAWFSPISLTNQKYRKAKLLFQVNQGDVRGTRTTYDWQQVQAGTTQHEIFDLKRLSDLPKDLNVSISCYPDATKELDTAVPYALAVTLEVAEGIDIYQAIKQANAAMIGVKP